MSVAERGYDSRGLLFEGYDDHQPPTWAYALLVEALATAALVPFAMVRCRDHGEDRVEMRRHFGVAHFRIEDVVTPGVREGDPPDAVRCPRFSENGPINHANA
jgi:hypothetical protein